jgi:hypothetical protein
MTAPLLITSHIGYALQDRKRLVIRNAPAGCRGFSIQDMSRNAVQSMLGNENWMPVLHASLHAHRGPWGDALVGDFSELRRPGIYRAVLDDGAAGRSVQFAIADGVGGDLPRLMLDYVHAQRCGEHHDHLRGPCHLDDARRSDDGRQVDVTGGWHDAGDARKWMHHATLPALALEAWHQRGAGRWNHWRSAYQDDVLDEIAWGASFILRMQDPENGMIWEDVGGGGDARRKPGVSWWYDNVSGCYADNADNRFTDNIPGSGDERNVRTAYHPTVQYVNLLVLLRSSAALVSTDRALSERCRTAARRIWAYVQGKSGDELHGWTSVRSWRLQAVLALNMAEMADVNEVRRATQALLANRHEGLAWWHFDASRSDLHRGVLSAAQPLQALAELVRWDGDAALVSQARAALAATWDGYIAPMLAATPYGMMPYGAYLAPITEGDDYHPLAGTGCLFRCFMPERVAHGVRLGTNSHITSWGHALATVGNVLGDERWRQVAWDQLHWIAGSNPFGISLISGVGYGEPMPHSRLLGRITGGIMNGPRGDSADQPVQDTEHGADWATCEYWNPIVANAMLALAELLPTNIDPYGKLGRTARE